MSKDFFYNFSLYSIILHDCILIIQNLGFQCGILAHACNTLTIPNSPKPFLPCFSCPMTPFLSWLIVSLLHSCHIFKKAESRKETLSCPLSSFPKGIHQEQTYSFQGRKFGMYHCPWETVYLCVHFTCSCIYVLGCLCTFVKFAYIFPFNFVAHMPTYLKLLFVVLKFSDWTLLGYSSIFCCATSHMHIDN